MDYGSCAYWDHHRANFHSKPLIEFLAVVKVNLPASAPSWASLPQTSVGDGFHFWILACPSCSIEWTPPGEQQVVTQCPSPGQATAMIVEDHSRTIYIQPCDSKSRAGSSLVFRASTSANTLYPSLQTGTSQILAKSLQFGKVSQSVFGTNHSSEVCKHSTLVIHFLQCGLWQTAPRKIKAEGSRQMVESLTERTLRQGSRTPDLMVSWALFMCSLWESPFSKGSLLSIAKPRLCSLRAETAPASGFRPSILYSGS